MSEVHGTTTGRHSCSRPNLQPVPSTLVGKSFRDIFKPKRMVRVDFTEFEKKIRDFLLRGGRFIL